MATISPPRRTKILATLGPATDKPGVLEKLIRAGADVMRLNFSHGDFEQHRERALRIRETARDQGRQVGIIVDLQGPKIRIQRFKNKQVELNAGDSFVLDAALPADEGDETRVGITYKELPNDVQANDVLLLDDGRITFKVDSVEGTEVRCTVLNGGTLYNSKGINRKGGGLSATALTDKDRQDIHYAAELDADYLAISFPRSADDIYEARRLLRAAGGKGRIIAKIERAEAMDAIEEIILASDAVMIARGDLGVEIGDEALPPAQKMIIQMARSLNRAVITATQMMESMITSQIPTRAEVFDVANAVLDGTDAVMLSAETAAGRYPVQAVEAMGRICQKAERQRVTMVSDHRINTRFTLIEEGIAMSAMYAANHLGAKAIAALTESGTTPLWMSRISSGIPIYALSRQVYTRRQVTLYRGVYPISFDVSTMDDTVHANHEILKELVRIGAVGDGDLVVITKGDLRGVGGATNSMKIVRVGEYPPQEADEDQTADKTFSPDPLTQ